MLDFQWRINKNALLQTVFFLAVLPTGISYSLSAENSRDILGTFDIIILRRKIFGIRFGRLVPSPSPSTLLTQPM